MTRIVLSLASIAGAVNAAATPSLAIVGVLGIAALVVVLFYAMRNDLSITLPSRDNDKPRVISLRRGPEAQRRDRDRRERKAARRRRDTEDRS